MITWYESRPGIKINPVLLKNTISYNFPAKYLSLLKETDGGVPNTSDFEYFDVFLKKNLGQAIGVFYSLVLQEDLNLIEEYENPPEFFPKDLVAFAETGNGDLICFDYRHNPLTDNPPIVYWNHEADIGKDVSFIANDFEQFLSLLHEPDDDF